MKKRRFLLCFITVMIMGIILGCSQEKKETTGSAESEITNSEGETQTTETESEYAAEWVMEPNIEADNIYYIQGLNLSKSYNEQNIQRMDQYAVIEKDGSLGLIKMDGELFGGMDYQSIHSFGYNEQILLYRTDATFVEKNEYGEYGCDWKNFIMNGDEISPVMGLGGGDFCYVYYWDGEQIKVYDEAAFIYKEDVYRDQIQYAVPVSEDKEPEKFVSGNELLHPEYAVCHNGEITTDFIYEECGPESSGVLAVKKDGKWGYINNKGDVVIPYEYDISWSYAQHDEMGEYNMEYCYGASEGFVPLCKNGSWEMRDINGEIVIPLGYFEAIRPVYEGKCWVKKDGKWGVIKIYDYEEYEPEVVENSWKQAYIDYINENIQDGDNYAQCMLLYINDDDIPELLVNYGTTAEGGYMCYFDGTQLQTVWVWDSSVSYLERKNIFCSSRVHMDDGEDIGYSIINGEFVEVFNGRFNSGYPEIEFDEDGMIIYHYYWNDEEVSKEEYYNNKKEVFDSEHALSGAPYMNEITVYNKSEMLDFLQNY